MTGKVVSAQALKPVASQDEMLIRMWTHGRQPKTVAAYTSDAARFQAFVDKPLGAVTLADLQAYANTLDGFAHATRARRLASVKSLFAFALQLGAIRLNPAAALRVEKVQSTSAERILTEPDVRRMIDGERDLRRRAALRVLYRTGARASELCAMRWCDVTGSAAKGYEVQVLGKGAKLRKITVAADVVKEVAALSPGYAPDDPFVPGADGKPMSYAALVRIVKRAAKRIGLEQSVSPHWWRHASLSHAMDLGMKVHEAREVAGHASLATTTGYAHAKKGEGLAAYLRA